MRLLLLSFMLAVGIGTANATPITVDLNAGAPVGGVDSFVVQGYEFSFGPDPIPLPPPYNNGFITPDFAFCPGCEMYMEAANGSAFSLISVDAFASFGSTTDTLEVTGFFKDGSSDSLLFQMDNVAGTFAIGWDNLDRVVFDNLDDDPTSMPRLVASQVPLPAGFWLLGSALLAMRSVRRFR